MGTGMEARKDTAEGRKEKLAVKRAQSPEAPAGTGKEQSGAENVAPRKAGSTRTTAILTPTRGTATSAVKRSRRGIKSTKSAAVRQKRRLPLQSQTHRKSLRDRRKIGVKPVPVGRSLRRSPPRIPTRWTATMLTATPAILSPNVNIRTQN